MKRLTVGLKFLITICFMLGLINLWIYFDPVTAWKKFGSHQTMDLMNTLFNIASFIGFAVTVYRIWKNENSSREDKVFWTVGVFIIAPIIGTYYIWVKEDQLLDR